MKTSNLQLQMPKLISAVSEAIDLINPAVAQHHTIVANIACALSYELEITPDRLRNTVFAAALHDVGGLSLEARLSALQFEIHHPHNHSHNGYLLLKNFPPLADAAEMIRYHHVPWQDKDNYETPVPMESHIIHLADRIAVLIHRNEEILDQVPTIVEKIEKEAGHLFSPDAVAAFVRLSKIESFWLEAITFSLDVLFINYLHQIDEDMDIHLISEISKLFSRLIDFRSPFTATHSSGVSAVARILAEKTGLTPEDAILTEIAGNLHDLGKLAVPNEILEKPGRLTESEFNIVRKHTFYTQYLLRKAGLPEELIGWAAYHHERLSGGGYPFHVNQTDLSLQARILAVADVFTALTEDRPYRIGMSLEETMQIMNKLVEIQTLDKETVSLLYSHIHEINNCRAMAQEQTASEYEAFRKQML